MSIHRKVKLNVTWIKLYDRRQTCNRFMYIVFVLKAVDDDESTHISWYEKKCIKENQQIVNNEKAGKNTVKCAVRNIR